MTNTLLVVLIILCICNAVVLALGIYFACRTAERIFISRHTAPESTAPQMTPEEMDRARQKFNAEMEAFQELMNYNQDQAYGINKEA